MSIEQFSARPENYAEWPESLRDIEVPKGGSLEIDPREVIIGGEIVGKVLSGENGYTNYDCVAAIRMGTATPKDKVKTKTEDDNNWLLVLRTDYRNGSNVPYFLAHLGSAGSRENYKGIRPGEELVIGRDNWPERFVGQPDTRVSRQHFSLTYREDTDRIIISDLDTLNGTYVTGMIHDVMTPEEEAWFERRKFLRSIGEQAIDSSSLGGGRGNYTVRFLDSQIDGTGFAPPDRESRYGYFKNHPIIGRDSPTVKNGVFVSSDSEALLVDDKSKIVRDSVEKIIANAKKGASTKDILGILNIEIGRVMKYDLQAVDRISESYYNNNDIIALSQYMEAGVGVCRHQAILVALCMEEMVNRGILKGEVHVERNQNERGRPGHAWAVLRVGEVEDQDIIVDPANQFVDTRRVATKIHQWNYYL